MRRISGMLCLVLIAGTIGCDTSPQVSQYEAALRQAATCDEVLEAIQEDAIAKVDLELKSFIDQEYYARWGGPVAFEDVAEAGAGGTGGTRAPTSADGDNGAAGLLLSTGLALKLVRPAPGALRNRPRRTQKTGRGHLPGSPIPTAKSLTSMKPISSKSVTKGASSMSSAGTASTSSTRGRRPRPRRSPIW